MPVPSYLIEDAMGRSVLRIWREQGTVAVFAIVLLVICSVEAYFYQRQTVILQQQVDLTSDMVQAHHDLIMGQRELRNREESTAKALAAAVDVQNRFIQVYAIQQDAQKDRLKAIEDELRIMEGRRR